MKAQHYGTVPVSPDVAAETEREGILLWSTEFQNGFSAIL